MPELSRLHDKIDRGEILITFLVTNFFRPLPIEPEWITISRPESDLERDLDAWCDEKRGDFEHESRIILALCGLFLSL